MEIDVAKGIAVFNDRRPRAVENSFHIDTFNSLFCLFRMNTILLIEKTGKNDAHFFICLSITPCFRGAPSSLHGSRLRVIPVPCNSSPWRLLIFAFSKLFKNPRHCGYLFSCSLSGQRCCHHRSCSPSWFPAVVFIWREPSCSLAGICPVQTLFWIEKAFYRLLQECSSSPVLSFAVGRIPLKKVLDVTVLHLSCAAGNHLAFHWAG
jgi:hypothetical protein